MAKVAGTVVVAVVLCRVGMVEVRAAVARAAVEAVAELSLIHI